MSAHATLAPDDILAGPHRKALATVLGGRPAIICEPLQFLPVIQPDRIARCGECGYSTDHPIARVCTHSLCPRLHGTLSK